MSLNESSGNQTHEKENNTVNIIYGVGAGQDSENSLPESKKYESCVNAPPRLEKIGGKCPVCLKEDAEGMWVDDSPDGFYYYCTNCYPNGGVS
jgi:hypothetical protein